MIGTMTIYFSANHQTADIGIMIGNKAFWGKGGEQAWQAVMDLLIQKRYSKGDWRNTCCQ